MRWPVLAAALVGTTPAEIPIAVLTRDGAITIRGAGATTAVPGSEGAQTFTWSADGGHLLFTRAGSLLSIPVEGGVPRTLASGWKELRFPAASTRGAIAFSATNEGPASGWHVYVLDAEGGAPRRIGAGYGPSWSADGKRLYFERHQPRGLAVHDVDAGLTRALLPGHAGAHTVRLSRDGRLAAFSQERALFLYSFAQDTVRRLTPGTNYDRFPSFSPDGSAVLFVRHAKGSVRQIVRLDLASGAEQVLWEGSFQLAEFAPRASVVRP